MARQSDKQIEPTVAPGGRERTGPRTIAFTTLGCKLNQYETEGIAERLEECGFSVVPFASEADIYVINTCTVTSPADGRPASTAFPSASVTA